ncbi:MAG: hypothetical protein AUI60_00220 [Thaumarchaeota archaeon 13_1_40CM_2_39_4]|nr:MAG: hypothetical protein AUI60_00220 [Thaumarchaeota archaeon 13_1_40CM_2_39_4]
MNENALGLTFFVTRSMKLVLIFSLSSFVLSLTTVYDAHAMDFTAVQNGNWNDNSTWAGSVPKPNDTLTISSGITVIIPAGLVVTVDSKGAIINSGTIINHGTMNSGEYDQLSGSSTHGGNIINSGKITNSGAITVYLGNTYDALTGSYDPGTISNTGNIDNSGTITSDGKILNRGGMTNSGTITTNSGGGITNYGTLNNNAGGTIHSNESGVSNRSGGVITNNSGGTIAAEIVNSGTIYNSGTITSSITNNGGILNNSGMITGGLGDISSDIGANYISKPGDTINSGNITITNPYDLVNNGNFINSGTLTVNSGVTVQNFPEVASTAITIGNITNTGTINFKSGSLILNDGSIYNCYSGTIINSGTIKNERAIINSGTLKNYGGNITGNPVIVNPAVTNCNPLSQTLSGNKEIFVGSEADNTTAYNGTVSITSIQPVDQQGKPVSAFAKGRNAFAKVALFSTSNQTALTTIDLIGSDLTSLGTGSIKSSFNQTKEMTLSFFIPDSATSGTADICVDVYSNWPEKGGIPLTAESCVKVQIGDSEIMSNNANTTVTTIITNSSLVINSDKQETHYPVLCGESCMKEKESEGLACYKISYDGDYYCKEKQRAITDIIIPLGSFNQESNRTFSPMNATVTLGINSTVQWINADNTTNVIVSLNSPFNSGIILPNHTWIQTFGWPGVYLYHDQQHPWMSGIVTVLDANGKKPQPFGYRNPDRYNGTLVVLKEGQSEGPLLVQKIMPYVVTGIRTSAYPLCCHTSPVTLYIGDIVSNGCTHTLTLIRTDGNTATFLEQDHGFESYRCPICLSGDTQIDTPTGSKNVKELKIGMSVWTVDSHGHKQPTTILKTGKTLVTSTHIMIHLVLNDGRELLASPGHPTIDGRFLGDLKQGDILDNVKIKSVELTPYDENYTYDILPSGPTGFYWADGILVGSTLK